MPIPDFWSGDEALNVVVFLETIVAAVWHTHGDSMIERLRRARDLTYRTNPPTHLDDPDDDGPF